MTYEEAVAIVLQYPGTEAGASYGTPGLKVRKKFLARLREPDVLVLRLFDEYEKQMLLETQPETFFITPHYEGWPTILIRLSKIEPDVFRDMVERAWREMAGPRLLKAYDAAHTS